MNLQRYKKAPAKLVHVFCQRCKFKIHVPVWQVLNYLSFKGWSFIAVFHWAVKEGIIIYKCCVQFLCPRHSKNGGGALSVTPVRACVRSCVRAFVRPCVRPLSKFGVRLITFERLHRFNSNLVCWYIISKHRSSSIWVTIHLNFWRSYGPFIKP